MDTDQTRMALRSILICHPCPSV